MSDNVTPTQAESPQHIWLSPICENDAHHGEGRTWSSPAPESQCEHCGEPWVEYVRSDLAAIATQSAEIARLRHIVGRVPISAMVGKCGWKSYDEAAQGLRAALDQKPSHDLPSDVVRLIIAARTMALGDWYSESEGYEIARKELDDAAEAFASRVEWPDTPSEQESGE